MGLCGWLLWNWRSMNRWIITEYTSVLPGFSLMQKWFQTAQALFRSASAQKLQPVGWIARHNTSLLSSTKTYIHKNCIFFRSFCNRLSFTFLVILIQASLLKSYLSAICFAPFLFLFRLLVRFPDLHRIILSSYYS